MVAYMDTAAFIAIIKSSQKTQSLRAYARNLGVSVGYLSDVYVRRREPGPTICKALGYEKQRTTTTTYTKAKK